MWNWLTGTPAGSVVFLALAALVFLAAYLLPLILSFSLSVPHRLAIGIVNALLGWTVVGWIGCLVWVLMNSREPNQFDDDRKDRIEPRL